MMRASGILYLSQTKPLATTAADGTFALTVLAYDRMGAHKVEGWRITWSGADALAWWQSTAPELKPGVALYVELERIRALASRAQAPEFMARVVLMYLAPSAQHGALNKPPSRPE